MSNTPTALSSSYSDLIDILKALPKADYISQPIDYGLQCGIDGSHRTGLLAILADSSLVSEDPLDTGLCFHAWRALEGLVDIEVVKGLLACMNLHCESEIAYEEFPELISAAGPAALPLLADYLISKTPSRDSLLMAVVATSAILEQNPEAREQVLSAYSAYLRQPILEYASFHGYLLADIVDLRATELIDDIRFLFEVAEVELEWVGDLEDVEIALGLRDTRETPSVFSGADDSVLDGLRPPSFDRGINEDNWIEFVDECLLFYGSDDSVLSISQLDGFLAAVITAPEPILPSLWFPKIWGEQGQPDIKSAKHLKTLNELLLDIYQSIAGSFAEGSYSPCFQEFIDKPGVQVVDSWCQGFEQGKALWHGNVLEGAAAPLATIHQLIDAVEKDAGELSDVQFNVMIDRVEPAIRELYLQHVGAAATTFVRESQKVGRNDPCPCGSGKKFKKCCM